MTTKNIAVIFITTIIIIVCLVFKPQNYQEISLLGDQYKLVVIEGKKHILLGSTLIPYNDEPVIAFKNCPFLDIDEPGIGLYQDDQVVRAYNMDGKLIYQRNP